ncbi:GntR family transcriptional regulator [Sphingomonas sp. TF3]|uniref:GntR family transcriptional regulator n=2 Tax=Sphingomonadales TaxID=204457 RepID=UPI000F889A05|nr:GntR family transcriptional regulator [Sphingomonas sp. TF3]
MIDVGFNIRMISCYERIMNHPNDAAPRNSGWQTIRDAISTEIQNGVLKPGAKLPTEPELCSLFGATRYAVRRAVEALAVDGKLRVEQGRGTFVESASKLNYRVGRRARFRQNLLSEGVEPDGEILSDEIVPASPAIAQALELTEGAPVHRVLQRSLADGVPISLGHTYVSALRFPEWPRYVRQGMSMSDAYRAYEVVDYFRGSTSVH